MSHFSLKILLLCIALFHVGVSHSTSLRCGNRLIDEGDHKYEVLKKCGEPEYSEVIAVKSVEKKLVTPKEKVTVEQPIEQWIYNMGRGRFLKILTFKGSLLVDIKNGPKQ